MRVGSFLRSRSNLGKQMSGLAWMLTCPPSHPPPLELPAPGMPHASDSCLLPIGSRYCVDRLFASLAVRLKIVLSETQPFALISRMSPLCLTSLAGLRSPQTRAPHCWGPNGHSKRHSERQGGVEHPAQNAHAMYSAPPYETATRPVTASAEVTQPEHARQSVKEIEAGAGFAAWTLSSVVTSYGFESSCFGRVSIGLMQATLGDMKSLRSSADRIALIFEWRACVEGGRCS